MMTNFTKKSFKNTNEKLEKKYLLHQESIIFTIKANTFLYIGKAKKLKSRILSHKDCNNRAREGVISSLENSCIKKEWTNI